MKIISIVGSPHGNKGNTARLLSHVLKGSASLGATNETFIFMATRYFPAGDAIHAISKNDALRKINLMPSSKKFWMD